MPGTDPPQVLRRINKDCPRRRMFLNLLYHRKQETQRLSTSRRSGNHHVLPFPRQLIHLRLMTVQLINSPFPQNSTIFGFRDSGNEEYIAFRAGIVLRYIIKSLMSITSTVLSDTNLCSDVIVTENTAGCKME